MVCQGMNSWTLSELVAAFLDLSIAYCLLCASALSYLASRFLAFFGLCLPCPCEGLFWNPGSRNNSHCLQRRLVDCPYERISMVRSAARMKTPFETLWAENGDGGDRIGGLAPKDEDGELVNEGEDLNVKGRRVLGRKMGNGLRRRRKLSSVSSYDTLRSDARNAPQSPPSITKEVSEDANDFGGDREASTDYGFFERASLGLELNESNGRTNKHIHRRALLGEELGVKNQGYLSLDKTVKNTVRVLEQALEEEHAARSALYVELEKERSAAASAADEAMAMILRLQEEKASIEMEARQYQRMIEAKAAYDAEEMNILKEILLRREREKHFLEKEVEAYREMVLENEQSDYDVQEVGVNTLYSSEDSMLKIVKNSSEYEVTSVKSLNRTLAFEKELAIPELGEDDESLKLLDVHEHPNFEMPSDFSSGPARAVTEIVEDPDQSCKDPPNFVLDSPPCVFDVHVVDEESKRSSSVTVPRKFGCSSFSVLETLSEVSRSGSDVTFGLPPRGDSRGRGKAAVLRRNSMSAVDCERVKIDDEVERLREKLRMVQEGREKLSFSAGHKEREKLQLQLLEDIAGQLREIRQLNEPGKVERQVSLPPSYSKVTSKKRRWRSASLNVNQST